MLTNIVLMLLKKKKKKIRRIKKKNGAPWIINYGKSQWNPMVWTMLCEEKRQKEQRQTFIEIHAGRYGPKKR